MTVACSCLERSKSIIGLDQSFDKSSHGIIQKSKHYGCTSATVKPRRQSSVSWNGDVTGVVSESVAIHPSSLTIEKVEDKTTTYGR